MKLVKNARKGISLPEIIAVVIVIAIIGGIALNVISGLATEAKNSKGQANAAEMNRLVTLIKASGGDVSAGGTHVDITSTTTAVADLVAGVTLPNTSVSVKLEGNPTAASYTLTGDRFSFTTGSNP